MNGRLEELERKAFQSYWDDGLTDTMFGIAVALIGFSWWQDMAVLGAVLPAVAFSLWLPLRKRLVDPRLGYVEFSGKRELKTRSYLHGMFMFMTGSALLGVFAYLWWNSGQVMEFRTLIPAMPALLIGLMTIPFAVFTGCRRFYAYTVVMVMAGIVTALLGSRPGPFMLAGGVIIALSGFVLLLRFLTSYPADRGTAP